MGLYWDRINKWLYVGTKKGQDNQIVILLDNWLNWHLGFPARWEWTLFQVAWNNGAFWGFGEMGAEKIIEVPRMNGAMIENDRWVEREGVLSCYIQMTILGVGLRYQYNKLVIMRYPYDVSLLSQLKKQNKEGG